MNNNENYDPYIYIVNEVGWEYNDSNYYRVSGVYPKDAFTFKAIASQFADDLNYKWFVSKLSSYNNPGDYFTFFELESKEEFLEIVKNIKNLEFEESSGLFKSENPLSLDKEMVLNLMEYLNIIQYIVVKVRLRA